MFGNKKKRERAQNLMANGARAVGTVTDVQDTGMTINDNPRVKLTFRIEPLDGSTAFDGQKTQTVSRVQIPQIGQRYPVFYDAADPSTFGYVVVDDEQGRQTVVQMFGDAFGPDGAGVGQVAVAAPPPQAAPENDALDKLKKLGELRDAGVLTDAEFEAKKAELLGSV